MAFPMAMFSSIAFSVNNGSAAGWSKALSVTLEFISLHSTSLLLLIHKRRFEMRDREPELILEISLAILYWEALRYHRGEMNRLFTSWQLNDQLMSGPAKPG
ncbi:uncharacterized protein RAG0_17883 [Rhynchosporium agropyri]|uniref:Uncharacterized protein n=1 Tax=Rhynchosporium agropyri TaxID=914238 RepID=A0A1E1LVT7_9HELO|nr:uncharacterized protein RAG0_17883 [Rhynchosporium agropyri]